MGWWKQSADGASFADEDEAIGVWGDGPADVMADAVADIREAFVKDMGRQPTKAEIRAGLEFHLGPLDEDE